MKKQELLAILSTATVAAFMAMGSARAAEPTFPKCTTSVGERAVHSIVTAEVDADQGALVLRVESCTAIALWGCTGDPSVETYPVTGDPQNGFVGASVSFTKSSSGNYTLSTPDSTVLFDAVSCSNDVPTAITDSAQTLGIEGGVSGFAGCTPSEEQKGCQTEGGYNGKPYCDCSGVN